jgi:hypothetical protein
VERLDVQFEDFKSEFEYFEIKRGEWHEELGERLDAAGKLLYKSVELGEESVSIGKKMLNLVIITSQHPQNYLTDLNLVAIFHKSHLYQAASY